MSICVCVCVFTFEVPFNGLFAPTSRSPMSKLYRYSESLTKSNGKKWSQIWNFLLEIVYNCHGKKKFFMDFFLLICSLRLTVLLPPLPKVQCPKFLDIWNPWGKLMERSGLKFEHFASKIVWKWRRKKVVFYGFSSFVHSS